MITGCQMREVRITGLATQEVTVWFHFYHVTETGVLPGAWSRNAVLTVSSDHGVIRAIRSRVLAYLEPRERSVWEHFPDLGGIRLTKIEFIRHQGGMISLSCEYDRLDKLGQPVVGFEGETLFDVLEGKARWFGGNQKAEVADISGMIGDFFARCEAIVAAQVLGIA